MRKNTKVSGAKNNNNNARGSNKGDSNLEEEVENNAEALVKVNNRAKKESTTTFSKLKYKIVATLYYCAIFSNIKKNPIHSAADTYSNYNIDNFTTTRL